MQSQVALFLRRFAFVALILLVSQWALAEVTLEKARASFVKLPIEFEPSQGQLPQGVQFLARLPQFSLFFREREFDLLPLPGPSQANKITFTFVNSLKGSRLAGSELQGSETNYLLGQDPSRWRTHVPNFGRVTYSRLYPGIDAVFYGTGQQLEHDFIVQPGADPHAIRLSIQGSQGIQLEPDGSLRIRSGEGDLFLAKPRPYQIVRGKRHDLAGSFIVVGSNEIAFQISNYDHFQPLVIDPVLDYSTFLANYSISLTAVATDSSGSAYVAGETSSSGFPTTPGAFQTTCLACPNANDVFISKFSPDGSSLVYSTFLGGTGGDGIGGITVDANGNAIVVGSTSSTDFPLQNPINYGYGGYGVTYGFVTSLSADGSSLNYSSLLGGSAQRGQSSGSGGTPPGTYTLTVTATAGTATESLPLTLSVQ